jgi:hypothetical protein
LNFRWAGFLRCRQPQQRSEGVLPSLWTASSCTGRSCMKRWTSPLCCSPCQTVRGTRPCLVPLGRSTFFVEHGVTIFALSTCRFVFSAARCRRSSSASTTLNACGFQCRPRNESYDQDGAWLLRLDCVETRLGRLIRMLALIRLEHM